MGTQRGSKQRRQYRTRQKQRRHTHPIAVPLGTPGSAAPAAGDRTGTAAGSLAQSERPAAERGDAGRAAPDAPRRRGLWRAATVLFWILASVGAVLAGGGLWVRRTFGEISVDQLVLNLPGGGGEGAGGDGLIWSAVIAILVIPLALVAVFVLLVEKSRRALRSHGALAGRRIWVLRGTAMILALLLPFGGATVFANAIGFQDYLQAAMREAALGRGMGDYYTVPSIQGPPEGHRENLVLIYLESVEDALADDTVFEENMLEPVETATEEWESIPALQQYEGGGWTMAGIVGTQCGIPLRSSTALADNGDLNALGSAGNEVESYMAGATCLGDVLAENGYRNVFLGGADARFAGKGAFLSGHGYEQVKDLSVWRDLDETEMRDDWGLSDRRLFERAQDTVTQLHASDEPFNLTLLTLDTHEGPRVFDYCDWDTEVAMTAITRCSMEQVAGFIDYLDAEGILEDTTVVVMGDHRKMIAEGGSFFDELSGREDRTIFNRVWRPGGVTFARPEIDQLSMYPTILELLRFDLQDHRAGIGVSALAAAEDVPAGSVLDLTPEEYTDLVRSRSVDFFQSIWEDPAP